MILSISVGGILRLINTVGAAHSFATGSVILGSFLAVVVFGSILLENFEFREEE